MLLCYDGESSAAVILGRRRKRETAVRKSLWHNQTHYRSLSLPAVYAANIDKECAYIFPFQIRNARHWMLNCCVTLGHIFPVNQAKARCIETIQTGYTRLLYNGKLQSRTSQAVCFFFFFFLQRCLCSALCNSAVVVSCALLIIL